MRTLRIWFKKTGLAIYISHLDMNRLMSRAVVRADIPLWYTEGFNPKPYLNFLLPLALGQEGCCEPLDIRIEGEISDEEVLSRLSAVTPQGVELLSVTQPVMKSAQITSAEYSVKLEFGNTTDACSFAEKALELMNGGEILAEKKSKRGIKTVNLCEMVKSFEITAEDGNAFINTVLATGSTLNLNPDLLVTALLEKTGYEAVNTDISRTGIFADNGETFK